MPITCRERGFSNPGPPRLRALAVVFLAAVFPVWPQSSDTAIGGTVRDRSGAVVPDASVQAINIETNLRRETKTNQAGEYLLRFLPVGAYRVEVDARGFQRVIQTGIVLELNRNAKVDVTLEVGATSQSVNVSADAPLVNTSDATIGSIVQNADIVNLPLVNRDINTLLLLTPGVESVSEARTFGFQQTEAYMNGSGANGSGAATFYLDGGVNMTGIRNAGNSVPNPDAVREFRVVTNNYNAEYGRFSGGMVDVITKSGTNQFHGSLFEFLRNDKLNARPWNSNTNPPLKRNQFGGTLGGPLRKDKLFVFGSYSGLRQRTMDLSLGAIVPTVLERSGDFSQSSVRPTDPATAQPFPGGVIPKDRLDPVATKVVNQYIPLSNAAGNFYQLIRSHPFNGDELLLKTDYYLNERKQLSFSYFRDPLSEVVPFSGNVPWVSLTYATTQQNFNGAYTWTISPTTVSQTKIAYVRNLGARVDSPPITLADLGSNFIAVGPPTLPTLSVTGYFNAMTPPFGPLAGSNLYSLREVMSTIVNQHNLRFGYEGILEKSYLYASGTNYGNALFDGSFTRNGLADFMLGLPRTFTQSSPIAKAENNWTHGLYFQDDWRVRPRLTLNLGIRYELSPPATDPLNRTQIYRAGQQSTVMPKALPGLLYPGDPNVPRGGYFTDWNNVAPRIGVAYDPFGDGKTSIRAGAGVFYGTLSSNEANGQADTQPFTEALTVSNVRSLSSPYGNLPGGRPNFSGTFSYTNPLWVLPASVTVQDQSFRSPYTYQMNFSVQRQIRRDVIATAAYVGSLARKIPYRPDINNPIYQPGATAANVDQRRPIQPGTLQRILDLKSMIDSSYNGLQLSGEKRFSTGFALKGFYVYGKSLDYAGTQVDTATAHVQDLYNLRNDKGRSGFDYRHSAVISGIWQPNYLKSGHRVARALANHWTLSMIATFRSGAPLTIVTGRNNLLDGRTEDLANLAGNPYLDPQRNRAAATQAWFNTAAFTQNGLGQLGNSGRGILDAPGFKNFDGGLFKDIRLREKTALQFRAEFTNAFNLVRLGAPNTTVVSPAFGKIQGASGSMRQSQLGLRVTF